MIMHVAVYPPKSTLYWKRITYISMIILCFSMSQLWHCLHLRSMYSLQRAKAMREM